MGLITIKVEILGGMAPVPVLVFIDKVNSNQDISFKKNTSFEENLKLDKGEYNVIISGENPIDGQTNLEVSYTNEEGISSSKKYEIDKKLYSKIFKAII